MLNFAGNSLWYLIVQSDFFSKLILLLLFAMSIICWTIFIGKLILLYIRTSINMNYKYQSKALSSKVEIFHKEVAIGNIQFSTWNSDSHGTINGKKYLFQKKSFWTRNFEVLNYENQKVVAEIVFETWKSKIMINLSATDSYSFNHVGFWQKKWVIFG